MMNHRTNSRMCIFSGNSADFLRLVRTRTRVRRPMYKKMAQTFNPIAADGYSMRYTSVDLVKKERPENCFDIGRSQSQATHPPALLRNFKRPALSAKPTGMLLRIRDHYTIC